ncbi:MAG: hypothetical protein Q9216_002285 [Gyalolechia sp. 2 TL-2023]
MKTRKAKATDPGQAKIEASNTIPKPEIDPVKLLLLPSKTSPDARICTLAHPATSKPCRYYICPVGGVYEFQRIAAPKKSCRSWLLGPKMVVESGGSRCDDTGADHDEQSVQAQDQISGTPSQRQGTTAGDTTGQASRSVAQGHTIKEPEMLVATPIDPLFLILPSLYRQVNKSAKGLFLSLDDLLEESCESSMHFRHMTELEFIRSSTEARITAVCDTVEAGDEKMYRLNLDKLTTELMAKAKRMTANGLPASMETKFVVKALETPVMSLKREESFVSLGNADGPESQSTSAAESQSTAATSETSASNISAQTDTTVPDQPPQPSVPDNIKNLLRIRTALNFILTSYLPPSLTSAIKTILSSSSSSSSSVDFAPLDTHLTHIAKLRAEAQASRSLSDFSRKRNMIDDDEAAEVKAEKKRKKEEEEKKQKASLTKGVRDLQKVNVSGMKKMSDFFGKSSAVKKKKT